MSTLKQKNHHEKDEKIMSNMPSYFRTSHAVITTDLCRDAIAHINKNTGSIKKIHIFVFNPEKVNMKALSAFGKYCMEHKTIQTIIHCYNKKDRYILRKRLKNIPKGKYFHFNLRFRAMHFTLSPGTTLSVRKNRFDIRTADRTCSCVFKQP